MKRTLSVILTLAFWVLLLTAGVPRALAEEDPRNNDGGVYNETEYREVIFITGEPVILKGTVRKNEGRSRGRSGSSTSQVSCTLQNEEKGIELSRSVSYSTTEEQKGKQTITVTEVNSFSETIDVGENSYELVDFHFSKSVITDDKPAVDYFTGNWNGRKVYSLNDGDGEVVISFQGETVGYDNPWGNTETQRISGSISFEGEVSVGKKVYHDEWSGTFNIDVTYNTVKQVRYEKNDPLYISFPGGYVLVEETEHFLRYSSKLPIRDSNGLSRDGWDRTSGSLTMKSLPVYKRLPFHYLRDMKGHWAEEDVELLYSLEIFSGGEYFGPSMPMTRAEFARALARALKLSTGEEVPEGRPRLTVNLPGWGFGGQQEEEAGTGEIMFFDVPEEHPYYHDIKAVYENDLIKGTGGGYFSPDDYLTRAQAITTFIRALGFEHLTAAGYHRTGFRDDAEIPGWAKAAVYVASEIGLVSGDRYGFLNPNQVMTRAEAATFLNRFIRYMQDDLRKEYRDKILSFR